MSFEIATVVFKDIHAVDWLEGHEQGEERFNILGMANDRLLFVVYTVRNGKTRIISARPATRYERRLYHEGRGQRGL